jgi:hypothetical protein
MKTNEGNQMTRDDAERWLSDYPTPWNSAGNQRVELRRTYLRDVEKHFRDHFVSEEKAIFFDEEIITRSKNYPLDWNWRSYCVKYDNDWQCEDCGTKFRAGGLVAHHWQVEAAEWRNNIYARVVHGPELSEGPHAFANLRCLCHDCHGKAHGLRTESA